MSSMHSGTGHFHAVRFYENRDSLSRIVADFLSEGLSAGQPALVIATAEHRLDIQRELQLRGVESAANGPEIHLLDAEETLASFMVDGMPDAHRFVSTTLTALERVCRGRTGTTVRAYGEMVDVLWREGKTVAAVRLEMLWNRLAATRKFSLLCGYSMGNFYKDAHLSEICDQHSHVVTNDGAAVPHTPLIST